MFPIPFFENPRFMADIEAGEDASLLHHGVNARSPSQRDLVRATVREAVRTVPQSFPAYSLVLLAVFNIPQIIAIIWVLLTFWERSDCDRPLRLWLMVYAVRLFANLTFLGCASCCRGTAGVYWREQYIRMQESCAALVLMWFILGNAWLLQSTSCAAAAPEVYSLMAVVITFNYVMLCLPIILALILLPCICFCLPCALRLLQYLSVRQRGVRTEQINELPSRKYEIGRFTGDDTVCAICLVDFERGEDLRVLHDRHQFHKTCVDPWLLVHATCPTCRQAVLDDPGPSIVPADLV